jgi:hypothetical protein
VPRDPTKTTKLRQAFRGEAQRKIRTLLTATQNMLVEQNALGNLHHPMMLIAFFRQQLPSAAGTQLDIFTRWFNGAIYSTVVQEGRWLAEHARRGYAHGLQRAEQQWTKTPMLAAPDDVYLKFYRNEIEGIADATVQQTTRAISTGLLNREGGRKLYRRVVAVTMKTLEPRLYALGHQIIVQMHNQGILTQLKAAGHTHVSVIPEMLPRKIVPKRDHAHIRDQELVNILTAGDDEVCEDCQDFADDGPHEIEEVENTLPLHVNCRCEYVPTDDMRYAINRAQTEEELEAEE